MNENNPASALKNYTASAISALAENSSYGMAPFGKAANGKPIAFMVGMNHIVVPGYDSVYTCIAAGMYQCEDDPQPMPVFLLEPSLFKDLPSIVIRYNGQPLAVEEYGSSDALEFFEQFVEACKRYV